MARSNGWCFTLHADEEQGEHLTWLTASTLDPPLHWADRQHFRYMIYQVEQAPETGKIHLQGYLNFKAKVSLVMLKRLYSSTAHWEVARGTLAENIAYCSKDKSRIVGPFDGTMIVW